MNKLKSLMLYPLRIIKLQQAIEKANQLYIKNNERYYVIPNGKHLIVINRKQFREIKRLNIISNRASVSDIMRESFYFTPDKGGNTQMNDNILRHKKRMYLKYMY